MSSNTEGEREELAVLKPRVGVSACLLGSTVRYDGGHCRAKSLVRAFEGKVDWVPVCPEVESGLPVPREALRLISNDDGQVSMVGRSSGSDETSRLRNWSTRRLGQQHAEPLDGFILKNKSPSCGLERVRVYGSSDARSALHSKGRGIFAEALAERFPHLPLAEEGWLKDARLKEEFLTRVFTHHRLRTHAASDTRGPLQALHARHKLLYLSHDPQGAKQLGQMLANGHELTPEVLTSRYLRMAMGILGRPTTRGKHANVLFHILGFYKRHLGSRERGELRAVVEDFREGVFPLSVPITLFRHTCGRLDIGQWLATQTYFEPFPKALSPRYGGPA